MNDWQKQLEELLALPEAEAKADEAKAGVADGQADDSLRPKRRRGKGAYKLQGSATVVGVVGLPPLPIPRLRDGVRNWRGSRQEWIE